MGKIDELTERLVRVGQTRTPEAVAVSPEDWNTILEELKDCGQLVDGGPSERLGLSFMGVKVHLHEGVTGFPIQYDAKGPWDPPELSRPDGPALPHSLDRPQQRRRLLDRRRQRQPVRVLGSGSVTHCRVLLLPRRPGRDAGPRLSDPGRSPPAGDQHRKAARSAGRSRV